ncbi:MAG: NADH:ubiquinone reductase (Na(+)-transporting) subunit A, partial [Deltaproteobacteria bacterium]|nr:NADH:ubiquinone reductase (Na(+)-transporting) subunit A [Deltaproteobacteria bacterium]
VKKPRLLAVRLGANIAEICRNEINSAAARIISGSVLSGRQSSGAKGFLGRYHLQICALEDDAERGFLHWLQPGSQRFSTKRLFISAFLPARKFAMSTAAWGGRRAIFPLGTYERVMPLDIMATDLLKALANQDTEKARELGCLELVEEDLALCSFVCPGKNNFGPMLRAVLQKIEKDG